HADLVLRRVERLQAGALDELRPLIVAESPDVVAAFQVVVHGAEVLGSVAVRHQAAPRTDQDRQMLDPDRALVLARAARRALPQDLLAVHLAELPLTVAGEQRFLRLQDDGFRVQLLARAPRGTVHLTSSALDACERVEHHFAAEILYCLEPDLLFLAVEIG